MRSSSYKLGGVLTIRDMKSSRFLSQEPLLSLINDNKVGENIAFPSPSLALLYPSGWQMCPYLCWRNVFVYLDRLIFISALYSSIK